MGRDNQMSTASNSHSKCSRDETLLPYCTPSATEPQPGVGCKISGFYHVCQEHAAGQSLYVPRERDAENYVIGHGMSNVGSRSHLLGLFTATCLLQGKYLANRIRGFAA
jgi:hypothetical protein